MGSFNEGEKRRATSRKSLRSIRIRREELKENQLDKE